MALPSPPSWKFWHLKSHSRWLLVCVWPIDCLFLARALSHHPCGLQ